VDRIRVLIPTGVASWTLLGQQGARLGDFLVPEISWRWAAVAIVLVLFASKRESRPLRRSRTLVLATLLASLFLALTAWRHQALYPPLGLQVTLDEERVAAAPSLNLENRRDLRRLAGRRRNIELTATASLDVPKDGSYRFDLDCDDTCELLIDERSVADGETLALRAGEHRWSLRYRQLSGPAHLRFGWRMPGFVQLLPMEYYIRQLGAPARVTLRLQANASLVLSTLWWVALFSFVSSLSPAREALFSRRLVPVGAALLVILYGGFLRVAALQVHSGHGGSDALNRFVPGYVVYNERTAPEDPYRADVRSYLDRAENFSLRAFYHPSFREPFYVAIVSPFLRLAGGEIGILIQSTFFACAGLVLFWLIAVKLYGAWWALFALVPVSLNEWLIAEAPTGYRMSAYAFFLLATIAGTFLLKDGKRSAALAGLLSGALCLIRLSALSVVVPMLLLRTWQLAPERRKDYASVLALFCTLVVAPFLVSNFVTHGDPFYSVSFHTEFWLRAEGLDASQGPVPWTRYFTEFDRGLELAKGTLLGMTVLPLRTFWNSLRHFPLLDLATLVAGTSGLFLAVFRKERFLTAAYFCHLIPFAYIQNFPSGQMPRFVMPAYFFLVLAAPIAARSVLTLFRGAANVERS